jgi:hypothetical protein
VAPTAICLIAEGGAEPGDFIPQLFRLTADVSADRKTVLVRGLRLGGTFSDRNISHARARRA